MRIDLNSGVQQARDLAETTNSIRLSTDAPTAANSGDVTTFSSDYGRAETLSAIATQQPEIRQNRVAALSAAIHDGTYSVSPEQTAEALLAYMTVSKG